MEFARTRRAAEAEKTTKWDLIAAIAADAVEADIPIIGMASQVAALNALTAADNEHTPKTVLNLCSLAKFDYESTPQQRETWRRYGWSIIEPIARSAVTQEAAAAFLAASHRTRKDVHQFLGLGSMNAGIHSEPQLDDGWKAWLNAINKVLRDGAKLAERSETENVELGTYGALAKVIYDRITERKIDAEIRQFLDSVDA